MVVPLLENYRETRPKWRFWTSKIHYPTSPLGALADKTERFSFYQRVIDPRGTDKNTSYNKTAKAYQHGRRASVVSTKESNTMIGMMSMNRIIAYLGSLINLSLAACA